MKRILIFLSVFFIFYIAISALNSVKGDAEYVGSETCKGCHEDYYNQVFKVGSREKGSARKSDEPGRM